MPRLLLLGRPDCHLCEEMAQALVEHFPQEPWQLDEVNVDEYDELRRRYGLKIPVLMDPGGDSVCVTRFDPRAMADWLAEHRRAETRRNPR